MAQKQGGHRRLGRGLEAQTGFYTLTLGQAICGRNAAMGIER